MQTIAAQILQVLPSVQREVVRVCDIGGGNGDRTMRILAFLHGKFHNSFELDFVEQSGPYVREFRRRRAKGFCKTRVFHALFERTLLPSGHYDLVLLLHSIFAFDNGRALDKVMSLRKPSGSVLVVANAPNSFLGGLKRVVDQGFGDERYEVDDLQRSLLARGVEFSVWSFETRWAIKRSNWKRQMGIILDWISLGRFHLFGKRKTEEILAYIAVNTEGEKKRVLFREKEVVVVIPGLR